MVNHVVVMAGGAGKRLWPASNSREPKQLMPLSNGKTLLSDTISRALDLKIDGKVLIVTHFSQISLCEREISKFPPSKREKIVVLGEPEARNTAPALILAAKWIELYESVEDSVLVLAADHLIEPMEDFLQDVVDASSAADQGSLVTFGIKPNYAATGYGYIEAAAQNEKIRKVLSFKEKPNREKAEEFLIKGNYFWNAGMFAYGIKHFMSEMQLHSEDFLVPFKGLKKEDFSMRDGCYYEPTRELQKRYSQVPKNSIDYALMEKSHTLQTVTATFNWNDIGSWDEVAKEGLTPQGLVFGEKETNYVFSDIPVAISGVKDLIVVVKNGSVMICPKGKTQGVKNLVEEIEAAGHNELL